jgi:hypothetical protein
MSRIGPWVLWALALVHLAAVCVAQTAGEVDSQKSLDKFKSTFDGLGIVELNQDRLSQLDEATVKNYKISKDSPDVEAIESKTFFTVQRYRSVIDSGVRTVTWVSTRSLSGQWERERIYNIIDLSVDGRWVFGEGVGEEAVRYATTSPTYNELVETMAKPYHTTSEVVISTVAPNYFLVAHWVHRWLKLAPDVVTSLGEGSQSEIVASESLGLTATIDSKTGLLRRVLLREAAMISEWRFDGEVQIEDTNFIHPLFVRWRTLKKEDFSAEPDDSKPWMAQRLASVKLLRPDNKTDEMFDWRTYMPFEYNRNTGVVKDRKGVVQPGRMRHRAEAGAGGVSQVK